MKKYNIKLHCCMHNGYVHMEEKNRNLFFDIGVSVLTRQCDNKLFIISNIEIRSVLVPVDMWFGADKKYESIMAKWKLTL